MEKYLVNATLKYRVSTVEEALELRKSLEQVPNAELASFNYVNKEIKSKGEVIETYILVTALLAFNDVKEPDTNIKVTFEDYEI